MVEIFSLDNGIAVVDSDGEFVAFYGRRIIARNKVFVQVIKYLRKSNLISPDEYIYWRKNYKKG